VRIGNVLPSFPVSSRLRAPFESRLGDAHPGSCEELGEKNPRPDGSTVLGASGSAASAGSLAVQPQKPIWPTSRPHRTYHPRVLAEPRLPEAGMRCPGPGNWPSSERGDEGSSRRRTGSLQHSVVQMPPRLRWRFRKMLRSGASIRVSRLWNSSWLPSFGLPLARIAKSPFLPRYPEQQPL